MESTQAIQARREDIVKQIQGMRFVRGTVNEQFLAVRHKGKKEPVRRGPYFLFSRHEGGRTVGHRLTTPDEVTQARQDVAQYKIFMALCEEFVGLTERLCELERAHEAVVQSEALKKTPKWRSKLTRK